MSRSIPSTAETKVKVIPDGNDRLLSLSAPDGSIIDVYTLAELPEAIDRAIGPPPTAPAPYGVALDEAFHDILVTETDPLTGAITQRPIDSIPIYTLRVLEDAGNVGIFQAKVSAYNARAEAVLESVKLALSLRKGTL